MKGPQLRFKGDDFILGGTTAQGFQRSGEGALLVDILFDLTFSKYKTLQMHLGK